LYLKSLTLRGFKSFASSTVLQLEPGITCVVGPNGSGKSNVVDALAWVMGEQGAKSLRGGKMEDVIFAGTSGRPPLGRAEVVLTIDNTDGALPIEYTEVTISRTMFRNGGSEYAINGQTCRLLDVQELLSDSGIGREMHVIVGQGQLDSVLRATPEERRGFIEEAAGVLKHRKRKEKALRKLDATQGNLTRLNDVLTELRRQLKPLGRQAEVARRAAVIQADVRDAKSRILADDIVTARASIEQELADETALKAKRQQVEQQIAEARKREMLLEDELRESAPRLHTSQETWYNLSSLRERIRGTASLVNERVRLAAVAADERVPGRDPEELEASAERSRTKLDALKGEVEQATKALQDVVEQRGQAEAAYSAEEKRIAGLLRAAADQREGLARLGGQVNAMRSRVVTAGEEVARLTQARDEAAQRAAAAQTEFVTLESEIAGLSDGESGLDEELEAAEAELAAATDAISALNDSWQDAERRQAALTARKEALEMGLERGDGAGALMAASDQVSGVLGTVAALVSVQSGYEAAVAAALGAAADAIAVEKLDAAVDALATLKADDLGRAALVVGSGPADDSAWPALPSGAVYAADVIEVRETLRAAVRRLLERMAIVDDLAAARAVVAGSPTVTAVTRDGDVLGAHFASGGSSSKQSLLEVQAAVTQAEQDLADAVHTLERLRFEREKAQTVYATAAERVEAATAKLNESDAAMAAVAEKLGHLGATVRAANAESERLVAAIAKAHESIAGDQAALAELEDRLEQAQSAPEEEPDTAALEELAATASALRKDETDARLALRTLEERARSLEGQVRSLTSAAASEREARRKALERRRRQEREAKAATAVLAASEHILGLIEQSVALAAARRAQIEASRASAEEALREVRAGLRELSTELDALTDSVHRDEMARAEMRLRLEALEGRSLEELGVEVEALVAEYGPDQPVPSIDVEGDEPGEPVPYVRDEQVKRLRAAEKAMAMLGRVNPLALEEFTALEERHQFLSEQLDDLRKTRQDLLDIVEEVDAKVEQVFTDAWYDVEAAFQHVFTRLFPGGEGQLVLTDPQNMLTTGVDVEARPAGKKVKRLSLLSGGERSLVAVAFLVALFKARPSPFYILDEVEAALDDANLGRLLELYEELRANSQLIVITHQKRTMEVADALYGVSMRGDGVSTVISQRLREEESA
jgi:chromosome segregation protein